MFLLPILVMNEGPLQDWVQFGCMHPVVVHREPERHYPEEQLVPGSFPASQVALKDDIRTTSPSTCELRVLGRKEFRNPLGSDKKQNMFKNPFFVDLGEGPLPQIAVGSLCVCV